MRYPRNEYITIHVKCIGVYTLSKAIYLDINGSNSYFSGMKSTVSEKGQITIPKALREKLGLRPGTVLDFDAIEGKLIGVKKDQDDRIGKWLGKGLLPGGVAVDDYLKRVRG
jgi:AbrB family looped-hinge helix DNA binding protein